MESNPALITQILNNFTNDTLLAVRSSGNVEDSLRLSFAGQFNTTLNVEKKQLAEAIIDSYNSARDYERNGYGKDNPDILMGLVVQEMIDPLYSGVIFTLDPTTGDHNTIVINYKEGLGEYLVSGKVTGTVLKLDKNNPTTTYNHLPENIVKEIVYISGKVEELFDFPQDIEFAVSKNGLHLLQSRPITSYSLNTIEVIKQEKQIIEKLVAKEEKLFNLETIFSNSNIIENFPEPTPMGLEIFNHIFTGTKEIPGAIQLGRNDFGYNCGKETFQNSLFRMICGKPFMDFVVDSLTFRIKGITLEDYLSGFTADYLQQVREDNSKGNYPEGGLYIQHPSKEFLIKRFGEEKGNQYHTAYQEFHKQIKEKEKTFYLEFTNELEPSISKLYKEELKIDFNDLSTEELVMKFNEYLEVLRTRTCVDFVKVARLAFFGYDRLKNNIEQFVKTLGPSFLKKKLKGEIEPEINIDSLDKQTLVKYTLDILLQAKPDNIINETERLGIALNELITNQLSVDEFILRYGHVGQLEISLPRYAEEKEYFSNLQKQESTENESKKTLAGFQFRKELAEQMLLIGATKEERQLIY